MNKRLIFMHPWQLYPAKAGNRRRSMGMLVALKDLGFDITVAGVKDDWVTGKASNEATEELKRQFTLDVRLYEEVLTPAERTKIGRMYRAYGIFQGEPKKELVDKLVYDRNKAAWLNRIVDEVSPDVVFGTYMRADQFVDHAHLKQVRTVMDSIDLFTLNMRMWAITESFLRHKPLSIQDIPDAFLDEGFIKSYNLEAEPREFEIYDRYDHTIAIVRNEEAVIKAKTSHTKVHAIPVMQDPVNLDNTYSGLPFFPAGGPNPYNLQGLLYLMKRILPLVRQKVPSFRVRVGGDLKEIIVPDESIELVGFANLQTEYRDACFMPCPVFTGTGQQVKITEAMAHGIPVVALQDAAERAGVRHEETGLVARNAEEYADHMLRLWDDRALCRKLGENARELIARDFSKANLVKLLSEIVC